MAWPIWRLAIATMRSTSGPAGLPCGSKFEACICAHRSVNFGLRMANTSGIESFCVGHADLTCCVAIARRWLLSARRSSSSRKKISAHVDRRSVRCRHVCRIRCATLWCLKASTRWRRAMRSFAANFREPQQVACRGSVELSRRTRLEFAG